ncbi:unnamed protein product [Umbelopsis ramanniana]
MARNAGTSTGLIASILPRYLPLDMANWVDIRPDEVREDWVRLHATIIDRYGNTSAVDDKLFLNHIKSQKQLPGTSLGHHASNLEYLLSMMTKKPDLDTQLCLFIESLCDGDL